MVKSSHYEFCYYATKYRNFKYYILKLVVRIEVIVVWKTGLCHLLYVCAASGGVVE
jgi:hypothetical protein